jgi:hypothetical protein
MTPHAYAVLAAASEVIHAASMVVWLFGLPLLFVPKWRRAAHVYAVYAIAFVVLSQGSRLFLGTCFLTDVTGWLWGRAGWPPESNEWFTTRLSRAVFGAAPTQRWITRLSEIFAVVTALGVLFLHRGKLSASQTK